MKVFMTGGNGFVGKFLAKELAGRGDTITILTRRAHLPTPDQPNIQFLTGDPTQVGPWMDVVAEHEWIINLAGASIFQPWTRAHKQEIRDSRILTTQNLVTALGSGNGRQTLFSTSAVGYYGWRGDAELTEESEAGHDFLGQLAQDWEAAALKARERGVRVVLARFGVVLGRGGGILGALLPMFRNFVGGPVGSGNQWVSWIDQSDHAAAFLFLLDHPDLTGPVNLCSPHPVRNRELAQALGRILHRPSFMPAPAFMVRLILGEFAQVVLEGQKALPTRLLAAGFKFQFPSLEQSLAHQLIEK